MRLGYDASRMAGPDAEQLQRERVEFLGAVWRLYRELHSASARMLEHLGVSGPQRLALRIIEVTPGITAGKLADALDLHRSTVSGLVNRLEELGLLTRRGDRRDRRVVTLELTAAGRKLTARTVVTIEVALSQLIDARGPVWRERTRDLLQELSDAIKHADGAREPTPRRRQSAS